MAPSKRGASKPYTVPERIADTGKFLSLPGNQCRFLPRSASAVRTIPFSLPHCNGNVLSPISAALCRFFRRMCNSTPLGGIPANGEHSYMHTRTTGLRMHSPEYFEMPSNHARSPSRMIDIPDDPGTAVDDVFYRMLLT